VKTSLPDGKPPSCKRWPLAQGKSLPDIAGDLFLGVTTVKTHVQHLYEKLGVSDRAAAVAEAMRRGLIE